MSCLFPFGNLVYHTISRCLLIVLDENGQQKFSTKLLSSKFLKQGGKAYAKII